MTEKQRFPKMDVPLGAPSHGTYPALSSHRPGPAIRPARPCRQDPLLAAGAALHRGCTGGHQPHPQRSGTHSLRQQWRRRLLRHLGLHHPLRHPGRRAAVLHPAADPHRAAVLAGHAGPGRHRAEGARHAQSRQPRHRQAAGLALLHSRVEREHPVSHAAADAGLVAELRDPLLSGVLHRPEDLAPAPPAHQLAAAGGADCTASLRCPGIRPGLLERCLCDRVHLRHAAGPAALQHPLHRARQAADADGGGRSADLHLGTAARHGPGHAGDGAGQMGARGGHRPAQHRTGGTDAGLRAGLPETGPTRQGHHRLPG